MKMRLTQDVKIGSRVRPAGTVLDVDAEYRELLIITRQGVDADQPKKKKKNV